METLKSPDTQTGVVAFFINSRAWKCYIIYCETQFNQAQNYPLRFLFLVLPLLGLSSLVIGMIYFYRKNQADGEEHIHNGTDQMATDKSEEAIEEKKDIIYVSVCCASVLFFLTVCYFAFRNSVTGPIEHSDYGSGMLIIFSLGLLTSMLMMSTFFIGSTIAFVMSLGSFMRYCGRWLSCFIIIIMILFSVSASLG